MRWFKGELHYRPWEVKTDLFVWQHNPSYDTVLSKQILRFNKDRNSSPDCKRTGCGAGGNAYCKCIAFKYEGLICSFDMGRVVPVASMQSHYEQLNERCTH